MCLSDQLPAATGKLDAGQVGDVQAVVAQCSIYDASQDFVFMNAPIPFWHLGRPDPYEVLGGGALRNAADRLDIL